jgi:hypothetical protein
MVLPIPIPVVIAALCITIEERFGVTVDTVAAEDLADRQPEEFKTG